MTDIVERLRALEAWIRQPTGEPYNMNTDLFDDAADEITALRAEVERLRAALERIAKWRGDDLVTDGRVVQMENIARAALDGQPAPPQETEHE